MSDQEDKKTTSSDEGKPAKTETPRFRVEDRVEDHVVIYANNTQAAFSEWDVHLVFGRGEQMGGRARVVELATLYLSPQHAKALASVLATTVSDYENKYGPINAPSKGAIEIRNNKKAPRDK